MRLTMLKEFKDLQFIKNSNILTYKDHIYTKYLNVPTVSGQETFQSRCSKILILNCYL